MLEVTIFNPTEIIFRGQAKSVILPAETGIVEILPFHRRMIGRVITGQIEIDGRILPVLRGVRRVSDNHVVIAVEES